MDDPTQTTTLQYKSRDGSLKELKVVQPIEPGQVRWTYDDLCLLARKVAEILREDG